MHYGRPELQKDHQMQSRLLLQKVLKLGQSSAMIFAD
jgi:hypothetical protein